MSRAPARLIALAIAGAAAIGAQAQGLVQTQKLSAPLANELVGQTVAICAQKGYAVTAVVVDLDGVRQALLRGNGAPIHTLDNAYYKAYSAASLTLARKEDSTKAVAERMAKSAPTTVPQTPLPNVTYSQGAIVIRGPGDQIIGALGVSGAPGGQFTNSPSRSAWRRKDCTIAAAIGWSRISRFTWTSCQIRYGLSVAMIAPTSPTSGEATRRPIS